MKVCPTNTEAALIEFETLVSDPAFSHTRARPFCGAYYLTVYHRDPSSPTGVRGVGKHSIYDGPDTDAILRKHNRTSPLSPTEGR